MHLSLKNSVATALMLTFAVALPNAAAAQSCSNVENLCVAAQTDPVQFALRRALDETLQCMAALCPDDVDAVRESFAASKITIMPSPKPEQSMGGGSPSVTVASLLDRIEASQARITTAEASVYGAAEKLAAATGRVRLIAPALLVKKELLPDYTDEIRDALSAYYAAKENYDTAINELDAARNQANSLILQVAFAPPAPIGPVTPVPTDEEIAAERARQALVAAVANLKAVVKVDSDEKAARAAVANGIEDVQDSLQEFVDAYAEGVDLLAEAAETDPLDDATAAAADDLADTLKSVELGIELSPDGEIAYVEDKEVSYVLKVGMGELYEYDRTLAEGKAAVTEANGLDIDTPITTLPTPTSPSVD